MGTIRSLGQRVLADCTLAHLLLEVGPLCMHMHDWGAHVTQHTCGGQDSFVHSVLLNDFHLYVSLGHGTWGQACTDFGQPSYQPRPGTHLTPFSQDGAQGAGLVICTS